MMVRILKIVSIFCITFLLIFVYVKKQSNTCFIKIGLASLNKNNVSVYEWQSIKAPKVWILHHKNWPIVVLEISKKFVKIIDAYGTIGWIKKRDVSRNKYVFILNDCYGCLKAKKHEIFLKKGSIARFIKIDEELCELEIHGKYFWIHSTNIWPKLKKTNYFKRKYRKTNEARDR